jgi:hypothetical protein
LLSCGLTLSPITFIDAVEEEEEKEEDVNLFECPIYNE